MWRAYGKKAYHAARKIPEFGKTAHRGRSVRTLRLQPTCRPPFCPVGRHGPDTPAAFPSIPAKVNGRTTSKKPIRTYSAGPDHFGRSIRERFPAPRQNVLHRFPVEMPDPSERRTAHGRRKTPIPSHATCRSGKCGIVELHRPARTGRAETAEHQQPCLLRQKKVRGVRFGHPPAGGLFPSLDHMIKTLLILFFVGILRAAKRTNDSRPAFPPGHEPDVSDERYPTRKPMYASPPGRIPRRCPANPGAPPDGYRKNLLHLLKDTAGHRTGHVMPLAECHAPLIEAALEFLPIISPPLSDFVEPRLRPQRTGKPAQ